jgi:hypothetical protein
MDWTAMVLEFKSQDDQEFSLLRSIQTSSEAHPASYPMDTGGPIPWGKAAGHYADHSLPSSAKVKETWIYTSTALYIFMA